ncbi:MAG TPA: ATP-binding protein, partial [Aggregatilineaceae bacterium]|nr:ATP-binding protein [Aggregatilineaceae bacterium]
FNGAHLQLARLFVAQVATAVRNMQLYMRLNQAERQQKTVNRISRLMAEEAALDTVLTCVVEEAVKLVDARFGTVLLLDSDQELVIRALYGHSSPPVGFHVRRDVGQAGYVADTGEFSVVTDYDHWELSNPAMQNALPAGSILYGVPLSYRGRVVGVLQVVGIQQPTTNIDEIEEMLMAVALPASIAIVNAELHEILKQDQQQLQAILDYTSAAVAVFGPDGSILLLNPEACRVLERLNIPAAGIEGRRLVDLLAEILPGEAFDLADIGSVVEINLGEIGEYLVHIAPIVLTGGTVYRYVAVGQDVSELRRLDRMKSDLIHILSHDLRNPLGLARGSIDLLDEPDLPQDQRGQLKEMIVSSLERMDQLIRDVVDLEMAQSLGEETALPYLLPTTVQKVIKRNELKANQQNVELVYQEYNVPPDKLKGHILLISQAIDNLVNNAIKYTPAGGHVQVTLDVEDEYAVIRVVDTGYGIPAEHLPHLFRQFYRVNDKRTRHIQGTGLGLSLVRAIAEAHGGRVSVESQVDVGSTFSLYLPVESARPSQTGEGQLKRYDLAEQVGKRLGTQ